MTLKSRHPAGGSVSVRQVPNTDKIVATTLRKRERLFSGSVVIQADQMTGRNKGLWRLRYGSIGGSLRPVATRLTRFEAQTIVNGISRGGDSVRWLS